ncbi:MAG: hypothetical protein WDM76_18560 [Limisphaerales bacterium]
MQRLFLTREAGLSFSSDGDGVVLWNAAATDDSDRVALALFASATPGTSFGYNPSSYTFGELSVAGQYGAFIAAESGDIGSPGLVAKRPNFNSILPNSEGHTITWATEPGLNYTIQFTTNLAAGAWTTLTNVTAAGSTFSITDPATDSQRFYRAIFNFNP